MTDCNSSSRRSLLAPAGTRQSKCAQENTHSHKTNKHWRKDKMESNSGRHPTLTLVLCACPAHGHTQIWIHRHKGLKCKVAIRALVTIDQNVFSSCHVIFVYHLFPSTTPMPWFSACLLLSRKRCHQLGIPHLPNPEVTWPASIGPFSSAGVKEQCRFPVCEPPPTPFTFPGIIPGNESYPGTESYLFLNFEPSWDFS